MRQPQPPPDRQLMPTCIGQIVDKEAYTEKSIDYPHIIYILGAFIPIAKNRGIMIGWRHESMNYNGGRIGDLIQESYTIQL